VVPIWEEVQSENVGVLKDIMTIVSDDGFELCYYRIPITAERPPDFSDLSELMDIVVRFDSTNTPMVVNCQLGRGRSTLTSVRYKKGLLIRTDHLSRLSCSSSSGG
jgi:protein-tyrosine phosphatase